MSENHSSIREMIEIGGTRNIETELREVFEESKIYPRVISYADSVAETIKKNLSEKLRIGVTIGEVGVVNSRITEKKFEDAIREFQYADRYPDSQLAARIRSILNENGVVRGESLYDIERFRSNPFEADYSIPWCISFAENTKWQRLFVERLVQDCQKEDIELDPRMEELIVEYRANRALVDFVHSKGGQIDIRPHEALYMARKCVSIAKDAESRKDYLRASNMYKRASRYYKQAGYREDEDLSGSRGGGCYYALREREQQKTDKDTSSILRWVHNVDNHTFPLAEKGFDPWAVDEALFMITSTLRLVVDRKQTLCTAMRFADDRFPVCDNGYAMDDVRKYFEELRWGIVSKADYITNRKWYLPCFASEAVLSGAPQERFSICAVCGSTELRRGFWGKKCGRCGTSLPDYT
ncbi:MAG: hypothetical protein K6E17_00470 [Clostridiales bacterium]|nr:hypothetical protein [Clostridiales bacterium]